MSASWPKRHHRKIQTHMTALEKLLDTFRHAAVTEREKGTYFEELIACDAPSKQRGPQ